MKSRAVQKSVSKKDDPRLPVQYIVDLKSELDADVRLLAELPRRIEERRRKLDAAMIFAPDGFDLEAQVKRHEAKRRAVQESSVQEKKPIQQQPPKVAQAKATWVGEVARLLSASERGMTHQEILAALKETELGKSASAGDKGFYNAVARLAAREEIVKHGGYLYASNVFKALQDRGEKLPEDSGRATNGSGAIVRDILEKHPKGLSGPQLRDIMRAHPDAPKSMQKHPHYIYTILGTLIGSGAVTRREGIYRTSKPQTAARNGNGAH